MGAHDVHGTLLNLAVNIIRSEIGGIRINKLRDEVPVCLFGIRGTKFDVAAGVRL